MDIEVIENESRVSHRCCEHGGGPQNLMGEGKHQNKIKTWGEHGGGSLKCCRKIPVKEFI